jgi:hypothetical protein
MRHRGQHGPTLRPVVEHDEFVEVATGMPTNDTRLNFPRFANGMSLERQPVATRTRQLGFEDVLGGGVTGVPMARRC